MIIFDKEVLYIYNYATRVCHVLFATYIRPSWMGSRHRALVDTLGPVVMIKTEIMIAGMREHVFIDSIPESDGGGPDALREVNDIHDLPNGRAESGRDPFRIWVRPSDYYAAESSTRFGNPR
jgi:hypothetical protein